MSFVDSLVAGKNIYVIPRGAKDVRSVIKIQPTTGSTRLEVFFPQDKYQVISDKTLEERSCTLNKYLQDTESWRKDNGN